MIQFCDIDTGKTICTKSGHNGCIWYSTILKDGTLVTVGYDRKIRFWN